MQALLDREHHDSIARLERELLELEHEVLTREHRKLCQDNFLYFVRHMEPKWEQAWFHLRLAQVLQDVGDGKINRVVVSMPPRHAKTAYSRLFAAWYLGRYPHKKIIGTSYNEDLAALSNRATQIIMTSERYLQVFPHLKLPENNVRTIANQKLRNSSIFEIEGHEGSYYSAGILGGITGRGATGGMIIDDPTKNYTEAVGTVRTKLENEWIYTLRSRIEHGAFILVIMTRWSLDDFAGSRLTEAANNPDLPQWTEINFPAVKDDIGATHDPRALGETLWPQAGYDKKWADALKNAPGAEEAWQAQYQQRPVVIGGGIIKTFRLRFWYPLGREPAPMRMPDNDGNLVEIPQMPLPAHIPRVIQSWDLTFKKTETGSFIVGQAWGTDAPEKPTLSFLLGQRRLRGDFEQGCDAIKAMRDDFPQTRTVLIEDKANGPAAQSRLFGVIPGIQMIKPQGDKIERARTANEIHTDVVVPHPAIYPWVAKDFLPELAAFPKAPNDDQVDAMTQYVHWRYAKPKFKAY